MLTDFLYCSCGVVLRKPAHDLRTSCDTKKESSSKTHIRSYPTIRSESSVRFMIGPASALHRL